MHATSRLAAALCLLGSAACAHSAPPAPLRAEPAPRVLSTEMEDPDRYDGRSPMFYVRSAKTRELAEQHPLYLMDGERVGGVPYLRPNDIASMEVVTGEEAVARYGVTPGRTVVLFTTTWGEARNRS